MLIAPPPTDKVPMLISYHYMRDWPEDQIAYLLNNPHIELLLDSGAFSALNAGAEVLLEDYIEFLSTWKDKLFGYMLLDKLGDPQQSAANYDTMLEAGFNPIPIHVRGDDEDRMNYLFERSAYVAMGGFRRPKKGWSSKGYVALKMKWAAGRPVHWLGYTRQDLLPAFRPYSCDSVNVMSGVMYGLMMVFDAGRIIQYKYPDIAKMNSPTVAISRALQAVGATWADLKDPRSWRANGQRNVEIIPHSVCCYTYVKYARWAAAHLGTRVFMATGTPNEAYEIICKFANQTTTTGKEPYPISASAGDPIRPVREWSKAS